MHVDARFDELATLGVLAQTADSWSSGNPYRRNYALERVEGLLAAASIGYFAHQAHVVGMRVARALESAPDVPAFHRVAAGDYETADGRYRLVQLDGGETRAWNVELTVAAVEEWIAKDPERRWIHPNPIPVDGAATMRDALALFADWWRAGVNVLPC